jgi:predicted transcriptional regulator
MRFPCEIIVKDYLPFMKAIIARELAESHKLKQLEIASLLGITQASVSYYLTSKRGYGSELSKKLPMLEDIGRKLAEDLVKGTPSSNVMKTVCDLCKSLKVYDVLCGTYNNNRTPCPPCDALNRKG